MWGSGILLLSTSFTSGGEVCEVAVFLGGFSGTVFSTVTVEAIFDGSASDGSPAGCTGDGRGRVGFVADAASINSID